MPADQPTDPLDIPLPADVRLPGVVFGKGVSLRTFIAAASRWKARADEAAAAKMDPEAIRRFQEEIGRV